MQQIKATCWRCMWGWRTEADRGCWKEWGDGWRRDQCFIVSSLQCGCRRANKNTVHHLGPSETPTALHNVSVCLTIPIKTHWRLILSERGLDYLCSVFLWLCWCIYCPSCSYRCWTTALNSPEIICQQSLYTNSVGVSLRQCNCGSFLALTSPSTSRCWKYVLWRSFNFPVKTLNLSRGV